MTSILRWDCDEGLLPSTLPAKTPHFFKIIHSTILGDGKLGIPKRFARRYGKNLSSIMFLKVPSGAVWQVGLKRRDGEVWLESGWQEFAEYYSIGYGHFLVFRYEGNSNFHVLIFDTTASEIQYPSTSATHDEDKPSNSNGACQCPNSEYPSTNAPHYEEPSNNIGGSLPPKMEEIDDDASVEILDVVPARQTTKEKDTIDITSNEEEFSPCLPEIVEIESDASVETFDVSPTSQNSKEKRNLPFLQPTKKRSNNSSRKTDNTSNILSLFPDFQSKGVGATGVMKFEKSEIDASGHKVGHDFHAKESCGRVTTIQRCVLSGVLPPVTSSKEVGALQRARAFNPENPFFRANMTRSYLGRSHGLYLPIWFVERYFKTDGKCITLWGSDGRTWSTSYRLGRRSSGRRTAELSSNWRIFVQDNQLKLGDVCVFELIKSPGILLKVAIFRNNEDADR